MVYYKPSYFKGVSKLSIFSRFIHLGLFLSILYWLLAYKIYYLSNSPINPIIEFYTVVTAVFLFSRFIIAMYYDDDHEKKFKKSQYPTVSFVIACKNEEDSIFKTIETSLISQYPAKMECIAVDDGSTDKTLKEMKRAQKKYGEKLLKIISFPKNKGKREAMSEGIY